MAHRLEKCCIIGNLEGKEVLCLEEQLDNSKIEDRHMDTTWEDCELNCFMEGGHGMKSTISDS